MSSYAIKDIARLVEGIICGDETLVVTKLSPFFDAAEDDVTFAADEKYLKSLGETKAKVVIVPNVEDLPKGKTYIKVLKNPRECMVKLQNFFKRVTKDIVAQNIESDSKIGNNVKIAPNAYIGHDVEIGDNSIIYPNVTILEGVKIGRNVTIYPNVTIREFCIIGNNVMIQPGAVIGSDGFGYIYFNNQHFKLEQIGIVVIEDNVEIGANTCIDRGAIGNTVIKRGTKIDNLVQIAHNDIIGENCIIISQVGIAGSVEIGNNSVIAGQTGIAGHLKIGDNVTIASKSGVTNDVPSNSKMSGFPLLDHKEDLKVKVSMTKLPSLVKRIKELEKKVGEK